MKIDEKYFKKVFNLEIGISSEETSKTIKSVQEKYDLLNDEAKEYFNILVKENELDPELEE